jgi:hypothetical protein
VPKLFFFALTEEMKIGPGMVGGFFVLGKV